LFDELHDGLLQALDLAMAEAGMRLAAQTGASIDLAVAAVTRCGPGALALHLADADLGGARQPMRAVVQGFRSRSGDLDAEVALVMADTDAHALVRQLLGVSAPATTPLDSLEHDAFAEIGNTLLNAAMDTLGHLAQRPTVGGLPCQREGVAHDLFHDDAAGAGVPARAALTARLVLGVGGRRLPGQLVVRLPAGALDAACERSLMHGLQPVAAP
jgi:hypothetical protein